MSEKVVKLYILQNKKLKKEFLGMLQQITNSELSNTDHYIEQYAKHYELLWDIKNIDLWIDIYIYLSRVLWLKISNLHSLYLEMDLEMRDRESPQVSFHWLMDLDNSGCGSLPWSITPCKRSLRDKGG